jgi:hypothetical protein
MTQRTSDSRRHAPRTRHFYFLEVIAAGVLLATMAALAWILIASYWPDRLRLASLEAEVIVVVALFVAALLLVSLISLLHTRD